MNRRNFLGAMLGAMAAPAVVKAENLMKIVSPPKEVFLGRGFTTPVLAFDDLAYLRFCEDTHDALIKMVRQQIYDIYSLPPELLDHCSKPYRLKSGLLVPSLITERH